MFVGNDRLSSCSPAFLINGRLSSHFLAFLMCQIVTSEFYPFDLAMPSLSVEAILTFLLGLPSLIVATLTFWEARQHRHQARGNWFRIYYVNILSKLMKRGNLTA